MLKQCLEVEITTQRTINGLNDRLVIVITADLKRKIFDIKSVTQNRTYKT